MSNLFNKFYFSPPQIKIEEIGRNMDQDIVSIGDQKIGMWDG